MKLLNNYCLIEILSTKDKVSNIIEGAEEDNNQTIGVIKAIGPGITTKKGHFIPTELKVNDKVIIETYVGNKDFITIDGKNHVIVPETDVVCKIGEVSTTKGIELYERFLDEKDIRQMMKEPHGGFKGTL